MRKPLRYLGLILILTLYIASGFQMISNPAVSAALLAKSHFPAILEMSGVQYRLRAADYTSLVQGAGAVFLSFSLFILLGVGRGFFAFMLAFISLLFTIAFHVNVRAPAEFVEGDLLHLFKNISIIGALLFVAGSGQRVHRYSNAHREAAAEVKKNR